MNDIEPNKEQRYTSIRISLQLREALKTRGKKGDTYDTIIKAGMNITFEPTTEVTPSTLAKVEPQKEVGRPNFPLAPSSGLQGAEGRKNKTLLPRISKHPEIEEKIIAMYNSGMKSPKIGKATGYSHQTIDSNLDRLRLAGKIK